MILKRTFLEEDLKNNYYELFNYLIFNFMIKSMNI